MINEIELAWKSIEVTPNASGWNTVAILQDHPGRFRAGRNFPEGCEALLAGFLTASFPAAESLPEGFGFSVNRVDTARDGLTWLALTRSTLGNSELFTAMVSDVANVVLDTVPRDDLKELRVFLGRIRGWQEFMSRAARPLTPEEEVGLCGELEVLRTILGEGVAPLKAIDSWVGPIGGLRDFELGFGAVEVKTTLAVNGFTAKIGSLGQLDDSTCKPLFVVGVQLALDNIGHTLPEIVSQILELLSSDAEAILNFGSKLLAAGYIDEQSKEYSRKFTLLRFLTMEVDDHFPRLTLGSVPLGVLSSRYEINIECRAHTDVGINSALKKLGLI